MIELNLNNMEIICDNVAFHKNKKIRNWLLKCGIRFIFSPISLHLLISKKNLDCGKKNSDGNL